MEWGGKSGLNINGSRGFPGGTVVENLPANAGDTGLISGLGRSHVAAKPVRATTTEPPF